jgi:hypothetical protein
MSSLGSSARRFGLIAALLFFPVAAAAAPRAASRLPSLAAGETLRYRLEYHSTIDSRSKGPIYTPETAHRMSVSLGAVLRLDVLSVKENPKLGCLTRLRVTYEASTARVHSDAYDPGAAALAKQYESLRGRSFAFTIDAAGRVLDISGLAKLAPNESGREAIRQWLRELTLPLGLWQSGLKPGKKWSRLVPLVDAPLEGLAWRTRSIYLKNESCPPAPGAPAALARQTCAVIETRMETVRRGKHGNPTPPEYRSQGLRTSGDWRARGTSLSYVSLATGLVTSSTASEQSAVDLTIMAALSGSELHYAAQTQSSSQLTLIGFHLPSPPRAP